VEIKRYFKLETLANAVEQAVTGGDRFVIPSMRRVLGPAALVSLHFELAHESRYQLFFKVQAANVKRRRGTFGLVVAKQGEDYSEATVGELRNLRTLYARIPEYIVRPFDGGHFFLPDRHGRESHGRRIFGYMTEWLGGYYPLGVQRDLQFSVHVKTPLAVSKNDTETLKGKMVEIIARSFDGERGTCMEMPQVTRGDFVATNPGGKGAVKLKLITCRKMTRGMTRGKVLDQILRASCRWGDSTFYLAPAEGATIRDALKRAVGREEAQAWVREYQAGVEAGRFRKDERLG